MTDHRDLPDNSVPVDQQDGGPGSHTQDGGETNDVASGGTTEAARDTEHSTTDTSTDDNTDSNPGNEQDVHGDPDTMA